METKVKLKETGCAPRRGAEYRTDAGRKIAGPLEVARIGKQHRDRAMCGTGCGHEPRCGHTSRLIVAFYLSNVPVNDTVETAKPLLA